MLIARQSSIRFRAAGIRGLVPPRFYECHSVRGRRKVRRLERRSQNDGFGAEAKTCGVRYAILQLGATVGSGVEGTTFYNVIGYLRQTPSPSNIRFSSTTSE